MKENEEIVKDIRAIIEANTPKKKAAKKAKQNSRFRCGVCYSKCARESATVAKSHENRKPHQQRRALVEAENGMSKTHQLSNHN